MALSANEYTYTGGAQTFPVNFELGFIDREDVFVRINEAIDGTGEPVFASFTWIDDGNITVDDPLVNGDIVQIRRIVSKTELQVDFQDNADVTPENLNAQSLQSLMIYQELLDGFVGLSSPADDADRAEAAAAEAEQAAAVVADWTNFKLMGGEITGKVEYSIGAAFDPLEARATSSVYLSNAVGTPANGALGASIAFSRATSGRPGAAIAAVQTAADDARTGLNFYTDSATANDNEVTQVMQLDHTGNLTLTTALVSGTLGDTSVYTRAMNDARYIKTGGTAVEVSVGPSGDFTVLSDAFHHARSISAGIDASNPVITVVIEDDYVWNTPLALSNGFYPVTLKQRNGLTVSANGLAGSVPMVSLSKVLGITFDIQLDCNGLGCGGVKAINGSHIIWRRGGVRGGIYDGSSVSGYNLFISHSSSFTSTAELGDAALLDFTGAQKRGLWLTRESTAQVDFCDFSDTGQTGGLDPLVNRVTGVFVSRGSSVYGEAGSCANSTGHGLRVARSYSALRQWDFTGCGLVAIRAFEMSHITSRLGNFTGCNGLVEILQGGADVDINGSTGTGITGPIFSVVDGNGKLCADDCNFTLTSGAAFTVGGALMVSLKNIVVTGGTGAVFADGAQVNALGFQMDAATTADIIRVQGGASFVGRNGRIHSTSGTPSNWLTVTGGAAAYMNSADVGASGSTVTFDPATHTNLAAGNNWYAAGVVFTSAP